MIESVIPDRVPMGQYLFKYEGVFSHVVANAEKSCPGIIFFQFLNHKFCGSGNRAVVKSEIQRLPVLMNAPKKRRE